jgi:hypothetical protein
MVLPLLGLLGLGVAAAGAPRYDEWVRSRQGAEADRALQGVGNDPTAQQRALLTAGLLSGQDWAGLGQDQNQFGRSLAQDQSQFGARMAQDMTQFNLSRGDAMAGNFGGSFANVPVEWRSPAGAGGNVHLGAALDTLSGFESGGNYGAQGPDTGGDRAYGAYQIMGANIGPWTQQVLGRTLTPEEFLADPGAQDAVAGTIFGDYVDRYGLADAYSMWHSGVPLADAIEQGRADVNMSTADYTMRLLESYGATVGQNAAAQDPLWLESQTRGQNWTAIEPVAREGILQMEGAQDFTSDMLDYVGQRGAIGRAMDDQTSAEWQTRYSLTVLPVLKEIMGAGALDENERAWFEEVMGDPMSWGQLTDREQARVRGIQTVIDETLRRRKLALGLNPDRADSEIPAGLTPGRP